MPVLMDGLLLAATLFAGGYCWVLARRVHDLKSLDRGLGGAIVTLTRQIELARTTLDEARSATRDGREGLGKMVAEADRARAELKLAVTSAQVAAQVASQVAAAARSAAVAAPVAAPPAAAPHPPSLPMLRAEPPAVPAPMLRLAESGGERNEARSASRAERHDHDEARDQPQDQPLPKPRALPPLLSPLRPRDLVPGVESEDALMEALSALAAGGRR